MARSNGYAQLCEAVGKAALREHEPIEVDGMSASWTLSPADGEELAHALAALARCGLGVIVRGGGSRVGVGNAPRRLDGYLSTLRLAAIDELDASEGVCHVRGGTRVRDVRAALEGSGWELPLDPPGADSTLGGCISAAAIGPRALGYGAPRDQVLGLQIALVSGERIRCGGRVVKNVTGYDLNKLYTGAFGTLGVIESAWLRLRAAPQRSALCEIRKSDIGDACRCAIAVARCGSARAVALETGAAGSWQLTVELAGDAAAVERDLARLRAEHRALDARDSAATELCERQARLGAPNGLRFRLGALASRLERALGELRAAGAALLAYPGLQLVYAGFARDAAPSDREVDGMFRAVASACRAAGGAYLCEAAPAAAKAGRDVFGELGAAAAITRALKQRFDPAGVLNPGRFAGHN